MVVGCTQPWLRARIGTHSASYAPAQAPALLVAPLIAIAAVVVVAGADHALGRNRRISAALIPSLAVAVMSAIMLLILETAATWIPQWLLPATVRRATVALGAGPGLWLMFAGGVLAVVSAAGWRMQVTTARLRSLQLTSGGQRLAVLGACLLLVACAGYGWLRYRPWARAALLTDSIQAPGWAIPWLGPLSLLAVWSLVAATVLALGLRLAPATIAAASAGAIATVPPAVVIITAGTVARLRLPDLGGADLTGVDVSVHATAAAWGALCSGLVAGAAAGCLAAARRGRPPRGDVVCRDADFAEQDARAGDDAGGLVTVGDTGGHLF